MTDDFQNVGGIGITLGINDETDAKLQALEQRLGKIADAPRDVFVRFQSLGLKDIENKLNELEQKAANIGVGRANGQSSPEDQVAASLKTTLDRFTSALTNFQVKLDPNSLSAITTAVRDGFSTQSTTDAVAGKSGSPIGFGTPMERNRRSDPVTDARRVASDSVVRNWDRQTFAEAIDKSKDRASSRPAQPGKATPAEKKSDTLSIDDFFDAFNRVARDASKPREPRVEKILELVKKAPPEIQRQVMAPEGPYERYRAQERGGFRGTGFGAPQQQEARAASSAQATISPAAAEPKPLFFCPSCPSKSFGNAGALASHKRIHASTWGRTPGRGGPGAAPIGEPQVAANIPADQSPGRPWPCTSCGLVNQPQKMDGSTRTNCHGCGAPKGTVKSATARPTADEGQWKGGVEPPEPRDPEQDVSGQYLLQADRRGRKTGRYRQKRVEETFGGGDITARLAQTGRYQESVRASRRILAERLGLPTDEPQYAEPPGGRRVAGTGKEYRGGERGLEPMGATLSSAGAIPAVFRRVLEEYKAGQIGTGYRLLTPEAVAAKVPGPSSLAKKTERMRGLLLRGELLRDILGPTFEKQVRQISPTVQQGPLAGQGLMRVNVDEVIRRELVERLGLESADALEKDPQLRQLMIELTEARQQAGPPRLRTATEGMAMWQRPPSFAREEMPAPVEFFDRRGRSRGRAMIRRDRATAMGVVGRTQRAQARVSRRSVYERLVGEGGQLRSRGRFEEILTPRDLDYVEKILQRQQEGTEISWEDKAVTELMRMLDLYKLGPRDQRARAEDRLLPEVSRSDINEFMYGKTLRTGESREDFARRGGIAEGETLAQYTKRGGMGLIGLLHPRFGRKSKDRRQLSGIAARVFKAVGGEIRTVGSYRAEDERALQMRQERRDFPKPVAPAKATSIAVADARVEEISQHELAPKLRKLNKAIAIRSAQDAAEAATAGKEMNPAGTFYYDADPGRGPKIPMPMQRTSGYLSGEGEVIPERVAKAGAKRAGTAAEAVSGEVPEDLKSLSLEELLEARQETLASIAETPDEAITRYGRREQPIVRTERAIAKRALLPALTTDASEELEAQHLAAMQELEEASKSTFEEPKPKEVPAPPVATVEPPAPPAPPTPPVAEAAGAAEEPSRRRGGLRRTVATTDGGAVPPTTTSGGATPGGGGVIHVIVDDIKQGKVTITNPAVIKETVKAAEKTAKETEASSGTTAKKAEADAKAKEREELAQRSRVERSRHKAMKQSAREEQARLEAEDTAPVRAYRELRSSMEREAKAEATALAPGMAVRNRELAAEEAERKRKQKQAERLAERQAELEQKRPVRQKLIDDEEQRLKALAAESVVGLDDDPARLHALRGVAMERAEPRYQEIVDRAAEVFQAQSERYTEPKYAWQATLNELERQSAAGLIPEGLFVGNEEQDLRRDVERKLAPPAAVEAGEVELPLVTQAAALAREMGEDVPKINRGAPVGTAARGIDYGTKPITRVDAAGVETEEEVPATLADYIAQQKAAVTTAQRGLPVRALSTSMIQTFATAFGPYGRVQERAKLADSMGAKFRAEERGLAGFQENRAKVQPKLEAALSKTLAKVDSGAMAPDVALPKIEKLTDTLAALDEEEQNRIQSVKASKEAYDKQVASVVTASDQMQHFAATFAGGIAGGIVGSFAGMIAQPIMQAFTMAVEKIGGPMVDQALGYSVTRQRTMAELSQGTEAAGGLGAVAFAQKYQFAPTAVTGQFASTMVPQAETINAAKQFEAVRDMFRTAEGMGGGIPAALYTTQGPLGNPLLADYKSIAELVNSEMDLLNPDKIQDWFGKVVNPTLAESGTYEFRKGTREELDSAAAAMGQMGLSDVRYAGFVAVDKATGDVADSFTELGRVLSDISAKFSKLDSSQLLAQMQPQMRAQTQQMEWQKNYQLETVIPQQRGMQWLANPLLPYGTSWMPGMQGNTPGYPSPALVEQYDEKMQPFVGKAQAELGAIPAQLGPMGYNAEGASPAKYSIPAAATQSFNQYKAVAVNAFNEVQRAAEAGIRALENAGVPPATIASLRQYAAQAIAIQAQMAAIQTGRNETKYQHSLFMANRALTDAKQLAGQIGRQAGSNVGYYERQLMLINRQNQALSLQLQKRQILTQLALARFQVPGETGEERYARRQEMEIAAGIQQKQLGLATQAFQTEIKLVDEQNLRAVQDAAYALQELKLDYQAQKMMEGLQNALAFVQAAAQSALPEAQVFIEFKNNYEQFMVGIATDIAARTEENMMDVLTTVRESIANDPVMSQIFGVTAKPKPSSGQPKINEQTGFNLTKSYDIKIAPSISFVINNQELNREVVDDMTGEIIRQVVASMNRIAQLVGLRPVAQ